MKKKKESVENLVVNYARKIVKTASQPSVLYQYTDLSALMGIMKHNELWATHWRYLNDEKEFKGAFAILKDCISKNLNDPKMKNDTKNYLQYLENMFNPKMDISNYYDVGLCSFSEEGDLLSQWRGYGKKYKSVSIGFNTSKIIYGKNTALLLCKVVYKDDEKEKLFNDLIQYINTLSFAKNDYLGFHIAFCILLLSCKDFCWNEEKEWRLLMIPTEKYELDFRIGEYCLVPYYKLKCFKGNDSLNAIKKILLPKSDNYIKASKALEIFNRNLKDKIVQSNISITY